MGFQNENGGTCRFFYIAILCEAVQCAVSFHLGKKLCWEWHCQQPSLGRAPNCLCLESPAMVPLKAAGGIIDLIHLQCAVFSPEQRTSSPHPGARRSCRAAAGRWGRGRRGSGAGKSLPAPLRGAHGPSLCFQPVKMDISWKTTPAWGMVTVLPSSYPTILALVTCWHNWAAETPCCSLFPAAPLAWVDSTVETVSTKFHYFYFLRCQK